MAYVEIGIRLTLAGVLLTSGFAKVRARHLTDEMVAQVLGLVRLRLPSAVTEWLLIIVEVCVGGILLIGRSLFTGLAMVSANRNVSNIQTVNYVGDNLCGEMSRTATRRGFFL